MRKLALFLAIPMTFAACGEDEATGYDAALLEQYRSAIPSQNQLGAEEPTATPGKAVGDTALYPSVTHSMVVGINGAVLGIIDLMKAIVDQEPAIYNSETNEFLWGPWPNETDYGTVAAYIKKLPDCKETAACDALGAACVDDASCKEDFDFAYALLRGVGNDFSTMTPVIWGAARPDPNDPENGAGVTLWDFEANHEFAAAHDPDYGTTPLDRGRFVAVYAAGPDETKPNDRVAFVVAVFRNFVPQDQAASCADPTACGTNLDYLYGRYNDNTDNVQLDFLDFAANVDLDEGDTTRAAAEDLTIRMAFINEGWGRAEVAATGGDLTATQNVAGTECWDDGLGRTFLDVNVVDNAVTTQLIPIEGAVTGCGPMLDDGAGGTYPLFSNDLDTLGIPKLADIDPGLKSALDNVALNGIQ